jgi:hypothetical protein
MKSKLDPETTPEQKMQGFQSALGRVAGDALLSGSYP